MMEEYKKNLGGHYISFTNMINFDDSEQQPRPRPEQHQQTTLPPENIRSTADVMADITSLSGSNSDNNNYVADHHHHHHHHILEEMKEKEERKHQKKESEDTRTDIRSSNTIITAS